MKQRPVQRIVISVLFLLSLIANQPVAAHMPPVPSDTQALAEGSASLLAAEPPAVEGLPPGSDRLTAVQNGQWPAQIAAARGAIQPNRYGPQRTDPSEGIPAHAYSPFDERRHRESPCPTGGCEYEEDHILVKLDADLAVQPTKGAARAESFSADADVNAALAALDVAMLSPIFPGARAPEVGAMVVAPDGTSTPVPDLTRWYRAEFRTPPDDIYAAVNELNSTPGITWAEPDYLRKPLGEAADVPAQVRGLGLQVEPSASYRQPATFNDPLYAQQWHMAASNVPQTWDWLAANGYPAGGDRDIIVAIIDTGVDYTHPDLAANMWVNAAEFNGTAGVDDDGNGYRDDIYGADTVTPDGNPMDDHGHGTHVAGVIGAQANNDIGGVGVAYNTQIMALKAAQYSGVLTASDIAEAIYYAVEKGADVINMSFGGYTRSQTEEDALAVAFGTSVLVAAAGNDGKGNLSCLGGRDMYPGAYNWVLGVMARAPNPDAEGDNLAGFSNFDCKAGDVHEYELMAPGLDIWSTLPASQYAAWDGTSMAVPVVAGIAALARTRWSNKAEYSSRFIMGQIATTGPLLQGYTAPTGERYYYHVPNGLDALTAVPSPALAYLSHWTFDTADQSASNDDDGVVDAGETIDLAVTIRNQWGKAAPVNITLEAWAEGASQPDPYVTMLIDTVDYGAIGSFAEDDNGLIYENDMIVGVQYPFRFSLSPDTPNDHVIPFHLTMSAGNGLDPTDPSAPYQFTSRFTLVVQRGTTLPSIISANTTLSSANYYIVPGATLIPAGVTVTVSEGTQIQFGGVRPTDPYPSWSAGEFQVEGQLNVSGSASRPVEMFPDPLYPAKVVAVAPAYGGIIDMQFARVLNPAIRDVYAIDHCDFRQELPELEYGYPYVRAAGWIANSAFHRMGGYGMATLQVVTNIRGNLYDHCALFTNVLTGEDNTFLTNYKQCSGIDCGSGAKPGYRVLPPAFLRTAFPTEYQGKTYVALQKPYDVPLATYLQLAEQYAAYLGGHTVTVNDQAENDFLTGYRQTYFNQTAFNAAYPTMSCKTNTGGPATCWDLFSGDFVLGLTDAAHEGIFAWLSAEPLSYTNWAASQPNNGGCSTCNEDLISQASGGTWSDVASPAGPVILEFLGTVSAGSLETARQYFVQDGPFNSFKNNAILMNWWDLTTRHYMQFYAEDPRDFVRYLTNNFWSTTNTALIDYVVTDYNDNFNLGIYDYQPVLPVAPATAYPFVSHVTLASGLNSDTSVVGPGALTFTIRFNRDMDVATPPIVTFGPAAPYTDYDVPGSWQDARTWVGVYNITPTTGDGYQLIRVVDAVAADDPWLVTGDDAGRFRFEIITSGAASMNLQATGGEGYVDLMWVQDDFDLLAGYNLYRSTSREGTYTRINDTIIPPDQKTWRDTNVTPGIPYYYYFTVVKSDMAESDPSNITEGTPVDTIAPSITHTPISSATYGLGLSIAADATDNVAVDAVTLFYRTMGTTPYTSAAMAHTTGNRYSATIPGSAVVAPGLEYYIEATDGISTARHGTASTPHPVTVTDKPTVTSVTPNKGPVGGGTAVTITGSNFISGATVTFGGAAAGSVVVTSSSQITCVTPAHYAAVVDVTVTNPGGGAGTRLSGYTYESAATRLALPDASGGQNTAVEIPVNAANVAGLVAAGFTVTFDPAVLAPTGASRGNLTPGWTLSANTGVSGQLRVSMASGSSSVTGSGVLANLQFNVIGGPASTTVLGFTEVLLNDGAIPFETNSGSFQVHQVYSVAGATRFWNGGAGVPGATLTLSGARVYTGASGATGAYTVGGAPAGDYTLTPSKADGASEITAYDASLALQHDSGVAVLSGYAVRAADVNKSSAVTAMDAHYILEKAVDLIALPFPGAGVVWAFDPASRSYTDLSANLTDQDFTAILLGDVSGNWAAGGGTMMAEERVSAAVPSVRIEMGSASLALLEVISAPGAGVTLDLMLEANTGAVQGVDLTLGYDPAVVDFIGATLGDLPADWALAQNEATPGVIKLGLAGSTPVSDDRILARLTFGAIGEKGEASPVTFVRGDLNEGQVGASTSTGGILIDTPPVLDLAASLEDGPGSGVVTLRWTSVGEDAHHYEVWRAFGAPYFTPEAGGVLLKDNIAPASAMNYSDPHGQAAQPGVAVFYLVLAVDSSGRPSPAYHRVGVMTFGLQPGVTP